LWAREKMANSVDVLFVDEAGQVSLAYALAASQGAGSLVLLGDPQQLDQPVKGVHPPGTDISALAHLLNGQTTIGNEQGLFLLESNPTWTDRDGVTKPITIDDILVVAPYNAQVSALRKSLPDEARIGTVDKFQGQEAPVVIYSMATSTPEDAPRGMEFLYSSNRLNVATSRAQC